MMNYEIENNKFGNTWVNVIGLNPKKETMTIEIVHCENPKGNNSLPHLWYKNGFTDKEFDTYLTCHTYVDDSEGNCYGRYNPTVKRSEDNKRNVINFDWMFEDTEENMIKIIEECIRLFESATGKSATDEKIERIMNYAKENGMEVVYEIPIGWKAQPKVIDPYGSVTIVNDERFLKRIKGKLQLNPNYKEKLMII